MIEINKCKLVPGLVATWGEVTGNIENQADLVSYISAHGGGNAEWGSISGNLSDQTDLMEYLDRFATTTWVSEQNYLKSESLAGYATESWVSSQGYLVSDDLSQYATRQWVTGRGYATESWVSSQGYYIQASGETVLCTVQPTDMDPIVSTGLIVGAYIPSEHVEGVYLNNAGAGKIYYNYQTWEETQDPFITESGLPDYLTDYATQDWVQGKGYATQAWVSGKRYLTSSSGYAKQTWVQNQGYLNSQSIKTVNDQSLIGSGNIEISGLTPEQEEAVEILTDASAGVLYTREFDPYKEYKFNSGVPDSSYVYKLYNFGGDIYCRVNSKLYKWDTDALKFNEYLTMTTYTDYPLWMDKSGRVYNGCYYELDMTTGVATSIDMGENANNNYMTVGQNGHNIIICNEGIYLITDESAYKFNEETQEFDTEVAFNNPDYIDVYTICDNLFDYEDHLVVVYSGVMYEIEEGSEDINIVNCENPYFPLTYQDEPIEGSYMHKIGSEYLYLMQYTHCKLANGNWVQNDIIDANGGNQVYYLGKGYGIDAGEYLIGFSNYVSTDVVITTGTSGFKNTSWSDASVFAVDLVSNQTINGTKNFIGGIRTADLQTGGISFDAGAQMNMSDLQLNADTINMTVQGNILLNNNRVATTQNCIMNRSIEYAGPLFTVEAWYQAGFSWEDFFTTPSGRLFNYENGGEAMYEFDGTEFVAITPELPLPGGSVKATTTTDVYAANMDTAMLYKWDDANDTWVEVVTTDFDSTIWTVGSTIRNGQDYKLVNDAWVYDPLNEYHGNKSYLVGSDVFVVSGSTLYQYDESTKTYTNLGQVVNASVNWFIFNDELYYTTWNNKVFKIDPDLFESGNYLGVETDIFCESYAQFYGACQYSDYLYTTKTDGSFGHCYDIDESLPVMPVVNGTYMLQAVKVGDAVTYSWSNSLESRVSALESDYGDALTTTNNILGI